MKLEDFISNVLRDIDKGLQVATVDTDRRYSLITTNSSGVEFDIAVTTSYSNSTEAGGKAKVGIVEVLGAGVEAKITDQNERKEASRIKFTINVPSSTQKQDEENRRIAKEVAAQNMERTKVSFGFSG